MMTAPVSRRPLLRGLATLVATMAIPTRGFAQNRSPASSPLVGGEGQGAWALGERIAPAAPAAEKADAPGAASATGELADTDWDSLIPPDWDALREFEKVDFSAMNDGDPRARDALRKLQAAWKTAPGNPAMNDRDIRIPGFIVPLDDARGSLREFLLVPYFGACIHVPPPPANQIIHVIPDRPVREFQSMDAVRVEGRLKLSHIDTAMGSASWTIAARRVVRYTGP